jgi:hypothetical protein
MQLYSWVTLEMGENIPWMELILVQEQWLQRIGAKILIVDVVVWFNP